QLAATLLCSSQLSTACGECHSCKLAKAETHPDFVRVTPIEGKKIIAVDQIRALLGKVYTTPQISSCKVIILYPADCLNNNAADALLKCLEEPPAHTYFILVTAFASRLPATVRSRCRLLFIESPSRQFSEEWLLGQGMSIEEARLKLNVCEGRPFAAFTSGADLLERLEAIDAAVKGIESNTVDTAQLAVALQAIELVDLLPLYISKLLELSKEAYGVGLQPGRSELAVDRRENHWSAIALLEHAAEVQKTLRSVQAGSTLNAQLATEDMLVNLSKCREQ
ncbi:MAG: hypothetical protein AB8B86_19870, partial [Pseudomonadales bacterium]